ncbi:XrtA system polysaccharide chain length determinant [Tahibacter amnicola]|uniref:Polysaccharide chain length determinant protein (PEP-CTERM system associated) n=1 Tax=Tahibacter amnicola TaxID=2976241 RepID=A0ABY6BB17_9GAMM|nr:XrtA system polysaccharide chain length determinant [Tahibacter amnicola]UXI66343.1 hypothetical protein N4264_16480 [Tahibacter amnicola]
MSLSALTGPARDPTAELLGLVPVLGAELRRRALGLSVCFAAIALAVLALGLVWPKKFVSSTTILVSEENIIAPLMEGRAVPTSVADRAKIAREVIFSRRLMGEILKAGGWAERYTQPIEQERAIQEIKQRTAVSSPGANLIKISYSDSRAERTFAVARRYAELFIEESLAAKERESREAYEFIAARVDEYHKKLTDVEDKLKRYRSENLEARPGSDADVRTRVSEIRSRIEKTRTELAELQMRQNTLQGQLSGEAEISDARSRSSQYRSRLADLTAELDRLRLDYTDEYPDVVRVRHQIEDLQAGLDREERAEATRRADGESAASANPLYQQLRADLAKVGGDMAALRARITENEALLEAELDRGRRVADSETALVELTRDHDVNRDIYQDLLRRRENARVSMNLDAEKRGLTFRVQEPAAMPLQPSGLRLLHFALGGIALGALLPLALLIAVLKFDPRARTAAVLAGAAGLPVLVSIPEQQTLRERRAEWLRIGAACVVVLAVVAVYGVVALSRGSFGS